jgi:hypothetical protein
VKIPVSTAPGGTDRHALGTARGPQGETPGRTPQTGYRGLSRLWRVGHITQNNPKKFQMFPYFFKIVDPDHDIGRHWQALTDASMSLIVNPGKHLYINYAKNVWEATPLARPPQSSKSSRLSPKPGRCPIKSPPLDAPALGIARPSVLRCTMRAGRLPVLCLGGTADAGELGHEKRTDFQRARYGRLTQLQSPRYRARSPRASSWNRLTGSAGLEYVKTYLKCYAVI